MSYPFTKPTADQVGVLHNADRPVLVGYAAVNTTQGTGAITMVPASDSFTAITVLGFAMSNGAASTNAINFQSHTTTSDASAIFTLPATYGAGPIMSPTSVGIFTTAPGEALDIKQAQATAVGIQVAWSYFKGPS